MKAYIGTKVVQAEPQKKSVVFDGETPDDGYKVVYEDGYVSWSPKETFERCYREVTIAESALILAGDVT
jgi:hypothetical protein